MLNELIKVIVKHTIENENDVKRSIRGLSVLGVYRHGLRNAENKTGEKGMIEYNNDIQANKELFNWIKENANTII